MKTLALIALAASACLAGLPARSERLVLSLSSNVVAIGSNFTGARLVTFGVIERDAQSIPRGGDTDVVVTVRGPREAITVRRKEQLGPVWLNRGQQKFVQIPSFLAVFSSRPTNVIMDEFLRRRFRIGIDAIVQAPEFAVDRGEQDDPYRTALVRLKGRDRLYVEDGRGVRFVTPVFFQAPIPLPAVAPTGNYDVEVSLLADGVVVARRQASFEVVKTGFEEQVTEAARDYPLLSGLATAAMALAFGWIASVIFRRD